MEILLNIVVILLYGAGMYAYGYHKALKMAMDDMQKNMNELKDLKNKMSN